MTATKITDHSDVAESRLLEQFKNDASPNLVKMLRVFIDKVQEKEDMLWELFDERLLSNAIGETLNIYGRIVGQPRNGADDTTYRVRIRARIAINRSSGTINDLLTIAALLTSNDLKFEPKYPAGGILSIIGEQDGTEAKAIAEAIFDARLGGVDIQTLWSTHEHTFQFSSTGTTETDTNKGFGAGYFATVSEGSH